MMKTYKITLLLTTEDIEIDQIENFLDEQWEQTAAAEQGDIITFVSVELSVSVEPTKTEVENAESD